MRNTSFGPDEVDQINKKNNRKTSDGRLPPLFQSHNEPAGLHSNSNYEQGYIETQKPPLPPVRNQICNKPMQGKNTDNLIGIENESAKTWLLWSILNLIIFLPFFMFWIPALIFSLISRQKFKIKDPIAFRSMAKKSFIFNIACTVCGVFGYLVIILVLSLTRVPVESSPKKLELTCDTYQCYDYCRIEKSVFHYKGITYNEYWSCYENYMDYAAYQKDSRNLYCVVNQIVKNVMRYVCSNDQNFN